MKKDTRKRNQKDYYNKPEVRKKYREHWVKYNKKRFIAKPWMKNYWTAWSRCNNPNLAHYKCYGGRGIKFLITELELKSLWERDKATEMKQPTLDRIDVDGNYERTNCRFIEMSENRKRRRPFKEWTENDKPIPAEKKECEELDESKIDIQLDIPETTKNFLECIKYLRKECGLSLVKAKFVMDYIREKLKPEAKPKDRIEELENILDPSGELDIDVTSIIVLMKAKINEITQAVNRLNKEG